MNENKLENLYSTMHPEYMYHYKRYEIPRAVHSRKLCFNKNLEFNKKSGSFD